MPNHQEKYITKLLIGMACIIAAIFLILFACFERTTKDDWYFWGLAASVTFIAGLFMMGSAFVHKLKSDLIRRQKTRDMHKTGPAVD